MTTSLCRFCKAPLHDTFADLGLSPLSNSYVPESRLRAAETFYPLHAYVCRECFLVQLEEFESPENIFSDYAYFSSYSETWLRHAERYAEAMVASLGLGPTSKVVEIASNDGYLLQFFHARGIPVLGVEPAANVAEEAIKKGLPTWIRFFGRQAAEDLVAHGHAADLLLGNNVLAHVPDLNDFVAGLKVALRDRGVITMEFPHLLRLIDKNQFDTIYHEHFSYFSFHSVRRVFEAHGLKLFDVDELDTHGGSLRIHACHAAAARETTDRVSRLEAEEERAGITDLRTYRAFQDRVFATKRAFVSFLIQAKEQGRKVVGYGAPAKGNTLLNFCGVRTDLLEFTVDRSPHKQGTFLPGTRIPVRAPEALTAARPDYVLILPWNLQDEIMAQLAHVRDWGAKFVIPIPQVTVL